jgi:hypothetical protein
MTSVCHTFIQNRISANGQVGNLSHPAFVPMPCTRGIMSKSLQRQVVISEAFGAIKQLFGPHPT